VELCNTFRIRDPRNQLDGAGQRLVAVIEQTYAQRISRKVHQEDHPVNEFQLSDQIVLGRFRRGTDDQEHHPVAKETWIGEYFPAG